MSATPQLAASLEQVFRDNRRYLWGVCYRMTGSAADSDDLVQETFERALSRPPARTDAPWQPWLVRVAVNLSRDHLRRRRRRDYVGHWLPEPIETAGSELEPALEPHDTVGRYELLESVSYAFLIALEALTPTQRAVLLLADLLDYSAREVAEALELSEGNARTTLHRARRAMRDYDASRCIPTRQLADDTRDLLSRFLMHLAVGDAPALEALLARDVVTINDSNGRYSAARVPVLGASKVARFHLNIRQPDAGLRFAIRELNALPALVAEFAHPQKRTAPRFVLILIPDAQGRIARLHSVLAPEKLGAIAPVEHSPGLFGF